MSFRCDGRWIMLSSTRTTPAFFPIFPVFMLSESGNSGLSDKGRVSTWSKQGLVTYRSCKSKSWFGILSRPGGMGKTHQHWRLFHCYWSYSIILILHLHWLLQLGFFFFYKVEFSQLYYLFLCYLKILVLLHFFYFPARW